MSPLFACLRSPRVPAAAVAVAKDFSPRLQRYGSDSVVLDVGGLGRLLGEPPIIAEELDRAMRLAANACSASNSPEHAIGVAPTQIAALLLSSARPGMAVATHDVAAALAPLRLETLRHVVAEMHGGTLRRGAAVTRAATFWESAEKVFEVAERWGLTTIGEFAALPAGALASRLGQVGNALQGMARGVDASPLVPDPDVPRFFERIELEWPIDGLEPLAFVLARLLEPLSASLERADRGAAAIHLELRLVDRATHSRVLQLPVAMRDAKVLRTLLVLDLESHPPHAAIDIVTVEVDPAPGRVIQYSLLERARPSAETLATLTARLDALVGQSRCGQPVLLDSHGPDAFELRRFAPDERHAPSSVAVAGQPAAPVIEGAALRRFRPPIAIRVTVERGRPRYVFIDRRGMPGGTVEQCAGPWRSSGAWWSDPPRHWNRDEWDVALSDGAVCRLFQARDTGHWFMEGIVD